MSRLVEHVLLQVRMGEHGRPVRALLGEYESKALAADEKRRILDEDDPGAKLQVLPADRWHHGEYLGEEF